MQAVQCDAAIRRDGVAPDQWLQRLSILKCAAPIGVVFIDEQFHLADVLPLCDCPADLCVRRPWRQRRQRRAGVVVLGHGRCATKTALFA